MEQGFIVLYSCADEAWNYPVGPVHRSREAAVEMIRKEAEEQMREADLSVDDGYKIEDNLEDYEGTVAGLMIVNASGAMVDEWTLLPTVIV